MNDSFPGEDPHRNLSAERKSHLIAEFALRRKRQAVGNFVSALLIVLGVVVFGVLVASQPRVHGSVYLLPLSIGFLSLLSASIFQMINLRCPLCNKGQARTPRARYCHNCGIRLRRDLPPK